MGAQVVYSLAWGRFASVWPLRGTDRDHTGGSIVAESRQISVHLMDLAKGRVVQTWRFERKEIIRIGRSEQNDVVIGDPYASRFHTELHYRESTWYLANQGRHGTFMSGEKVDDAPLEDGAVFRLGPSGPSFRFELFHADMDAQTTSIYNALPDLGKAIEIDQAQKQQQVSEVAETPYFQQLQEFAEGLRKRPEGKSKGAGQD